MHESSTKSATPDLDYPYDSRMYRMSIILGFFVGVALENWSPGTDEGLTYRSTVLIAAIGAFSTCGFMSNGHKGWMIGLLTSAVVISAVTAIVLI